MPQQHAHRAAADHRGALPVEQFDRLVGEEAFGVVGVELEDRGAEVHLAEGVLQMLAHLAIHGRGELFASLGAQLGDPAHQRRARWATVAVLDQSR